MSTYEFILYAKSIESVSNFDNTKSQVLLFSSKFGPLMGCLGGGFYLHNISLPIYRNSKNEKKNVRDMFLGFFVVCISYIICGCLGAIGFSNRQLFF